MIERIVTYIFAVCVINNIIVQQNSMTRAPKPPKITPRPNPPKMNPPRPRPPKPK